MPQNRNKNEQQDNDQESPDNEMREQEQAQSLRQAVMQAKQLSDQVKKMAVQKEVAKNLNPARKMNSVKLCLAWEVLLSSCGVSILYVHFHLFAGLIIGSSYCKLGDEWPMLSGTQRSLARILEIMVIVFVDLAFIAIILFVVVLIAIIIDEVTILGVQAI